MLGPRLRTGSPCSYNGSTRIRAPRDDHAQGALRRARQEPAGPPNSLSRERGSLRVSAISNPNRGPRLTCSQVLLDDSGTDQVQTWKKPTQSESARALEHLAR